MAYAAIKVTDLTLIICLFGFQQLRRGRIVSIFRVRKDTSMESRLSLTCSLCSSRVQVEADRRRCRREGLYLREKVRGELVSCGDPVVSHVIITGL